MSDRDVPPLGLPPEDLETRRLRAECARDLFGDEAPDLMKIGRFTLVSQLGMGAQGAVYLAKDPELDRRVALKRLSVVDPRHRERLRREGQALAKITHPHVVTVFEVGEDETGRPFLVMELVDGEPLHRWLRQQPRLWTEIVDVLAPVAEGLAALHAAGLVHRDVKPHNIVITKDGRATLVDLGIAALDPREAPPSGASESTKATPGTVGYMAPEHERGHADARSDQFSFCVTLYEALHGARPPTTLTHPESEGVERSGTATDPTVTTNPSLDPTRSVEKVPRALVQVIRRGLQHDAALRHADMNEIVHALRRLRRPSRVWPVLSVLALVAAVGTATALWGGSAGDLCDETQPGRSAWQGPARDAVRSAFNRTGSSLAEPTFARVDTMLDNTTAALDERLTAACISEHDGTARQLAFAAFHSDHAALKAIVGSLPAVEASDLIDLPTRLAGPLQRLSELGPRDACEQTEAVLDPTPLLEQIETTRRRAVAEGIAGHDEAALNLGAEALGLASEDALGPVRARLHLERGRIAFDASRFDIALDDLDAARSLAETFGCDGLGAEALALWAKTRALDPHGSLDGADLASRAALEKIERLDLEGRRRAEALNSRGVVLRRQHEYEAAILAFREALEIRRSLQPPAPIEIAATTLNLGVTLANAGNLEASIETLQQAATQWDAALGPDHPSAYKVHMSLGRRYLARGDVAAAERSMTRALELAREGYGASGEPLADLHVAMAELLDRRQAFEDALEHAKRADAIMVELYGEDDHHRVAALEAIGTVCNDAGWFDQALPALERSLEIQARMGDREPSSLAIGRGKLARAFAGLGGHEEAELLYRGALRPFTTDPALRLDPFYPELLLGWAETLEALGRGDNAIEPLRQAIAFWAAHRDNPGRLAHARWWLAWLLCERDREQAEALAREALAFYRTLDDPAASSRCDEITSWLERECETNE